MPKRRAASRWLSPSTWQAGRTLPYSSTENIPRLPARSDRAQGRHQGGTVWHRRGRDTQPAVSEGHFLTAAYNSLSNSSYSRPNTRGVRLKAPFGSLGALSFHPPRVRGSVVSIASLYQPRAGHRYKGGCATGVRRQPETGVDGSHRR